MHKIFVSYRREDTGGYAGRLVDALARHFGPKIAFLDVDSIEPGLPFDEAIVRALDSCQAVLAVIGPRWLTITDGNGEQRIAQKHDYVHLELVKALQRDVRVIPVLVQRASMPDEVDLPPDLKPLARHQAIELSDGRWDYDVGQLIAVLKKVLRYRVWPRLWKAALAGLLACAFAFTIWRLWPEDRGTPPPVRPTGELVAVPDLRNLSLAEAESRLSEAGLRTGRRESLTIDRYSPGTVYNQDTTPGSRVRRETAIGLYVARAKREGVQHSGQVYLSSTEVIDLDGVGPSRQSVDIRFASAGPTERYLGPLNGAAIGAVGFRPVAQDGCASAALSDARVRLSVGEYFCVRTNDDRYALLRVDDLSDELQLSFTTWEGSLRGSTVTSEVQRVRLANSESYHFREGTRGRLQGGDFYVSISQNGAAQFFANNQGQRGLMDLGDVGSVPLSRVPVPASGYYKYGVPAVAGHTYVSLAREGEEGRYVIFRVQRVTDEWVGLTYVYR